MRGTLECFILVIVSFIIALVFTHFHKGIQFHEAYTLIIALFALFRTCKEEK